VILHGPGGVAIVDPGPSSTLPALRAGLEQAGMTLADVRAILLTHIHLDHAGATGTLVAENPALRVYVHEKGAPHMVDPSKLMASATRLWGHEMDRLWGDMRPVPAANLEVLRGGERIGAGGRDLEVAYTPGHASHHVSYFSAETGIAFVGDTAGVRLQNGRFIMPPTPPPDIDLEQWHASLDTVAAWRPQRLAMTHFGAGDDPATQLAELSRRLDSWAELARDRGEAGFIEAVTEELERVADPDTAASFVQAASPDQLYAGLERYWRKREERAA
jgi:glyoxylase-like metal-dependent hydrolase (beta-lactamase superfamily II)